jgi:signal transduction histidine kinase
MNTDFLLKGVDTGKHTIPHRHLLVNIKESSKRMNRLIEDLLDSVKFESGQVKLNKTKSEINTILKASIDESMKAAKVKSINLVLDVKEPYQSIECDSQRIIQVLNNLIGNAIKFAPENSEVGIKVWDSPDEIGICVGDNGPGIPVENQAMLFSRWQAKETAHKGTGLGLFISKQIIDAHQGRIWVSSKEGQGSVFCFSIPKIVSAQRDSFVNLIPPNP